MFRTGKSYEGSCLSSTRLFWAIQPRQLNSTDHYAVEDLTLQVSYII